MCTQIEGWGHIFHPRMKIDYKDIFLLRKGAFSGVLERMILEIFSWGKPPDL